MRAEVALLSRVIFRVDEDRVVWTRGHARFAADTDRFIEIDNTVGAFEHRRGWAGSYARRVSALIASRYLMSAARLGEHAYVDVFDVRARDGKRNQIFRLARGRTRVTADTARMVNYLGPLNRVRGCRHNQAPDGSRNYNMSRLEN